MGEITMECGACEGRGMGCEACGGRGRVPFRGADPVAVLRHLRGCELIELAGEDSDEEINGCDAVDLLGHIRAVLDEALATHGGPEAPAVAAPEAPTPARYAPRIGPAAEATPAKAMQLVEHVRALRLLGDDEAGDGAAAHLYTWALDAVCLGVPDARVIAALARGV